MWQQLTLNASERRFCYVTRKSLCVTFRKLGRYLANDESTVVSDDTVQSGTYVAGNFWLHLQSSRHNKQFHSTAVLLLPPVSSGTSLFWRCTVCSHSHSL